MKMWYKRFYLCLLVTIIVISFVKGSCLEYGHSCWGAHGKRSGTPTSRKIPSGNTFYQQYNNNAETNEEASVNPPYFENFDDLTVRMDTSDAVTPSNDDDYDTRQNSRTATSMGHGNKYQRNMKNFGTSWRKNFIKSLMKNDFLQQLERKAMATKENTFYDIN